MALDSHLMLRSPPTLCPPCRVPVTFNMSFCPAPNLLLPIPLLSLHLFSLSQNPCLADVLTEFPCLPENYSQALQYLVPLLHDEADALKRVALRRKIREYMGRTEELKKVVSSESVNSTSIPNISDQESMKVTEYRGNREELLRLTATTPQIRTATEIAASGELYAREGNYSLAFDKYQLALGKLLELLQNEPKGRRKDLLREEVTRWMSQAECLKKLLGDSPAQENVAAEMFATTEDRNCVLQ
ncbi:Serine/threonine-protein kinase ULK3 [Chionoecetes opilio]|uniref:Serine/threonine-protein kinase ULK3 n=1 Tax=Chionoecetes opilio TaxID=41210 RepID=A0A8J5CQV1_CHIOP|nr:Serine/threonine-protein kinase ULK3 [Chionoecetes opilio]